jgi:hypothetical protein
MDWTGGNVESNWTPGQKVQSLSKVVTCDKAHKRAIRTARNVDVSTRWKIWFTTRNRGQ